MTTDKLYAIDKLFNPDAIAVAGASANPNNLGSRNLRLIKSYGYKGRLYAINPKGEPSHGADGYRRLTEIEEPIDLCIVAIPAAAVSETVGQCVQKKIPVAQILTGGFGETGKAGRATEKDILKLSGGATRLVGPNCLGVFSAGSRITFVAGVSEIAGTVSIASQSGGLGVDMLHQAKARGLDLNKLVSVGNCIDIDLSDYLNFFREDTETAVVGLYIEGLRQGRQFYTALKEVCRTKPVVIVKGGRTSQGAKSVASHTNSLAGEYETWKTAADQAGAILVEDIDSFLALLTALQPHVPLFEHRGIALVGNGGGASVLATDLLEERGLKLATLHEDTARSLSKIEMPPGATVGNPTDTPVNALNKSGGTVLADVCNCLLGDSDVGGMIFHLNLVPFINYTNYPGIVRGITEALELIRIDGKPVFVAIRSVPEMEEIRKEILSVLRRLEIPCFHSPGEAVNTLASVYHWHQRALARESVAPPLSGECRVAEAKGFIKLFKDKGCRLLPLEAAFHLLGFFGIAHPNCKLAKDATEALDAAKAIGFPVALKIDSPGIIHKTDAGGVRIGLNTPSEVEKGFAEICQAAVKYSADAAINGILVQEMSSKPVQELICGLKTDPVFGKVVLVGMGGIFVELFKDFTMRVLPLDDSDPRRIWQELKSSPLLSGYRGNRAGDTDALEGLIQRLALLAESIPEIGELDLNPVMVLESGKGVTAVDCRVILKY